MRRDSLGSDAFQVRIPQTAWRPVPHAIQEHSQPPQGPRRALRVEPTNTPRQGRRHADLAVLLDIASILKILKHVCPAPSANTTVRQIREQIVSNAPPANTLQAPALPRVLCANLANTSAMPVLQHAPTVRAERQARRLGV